MHRPESNSLGKLSEFPSASVRRAAIWITLLAIVVTAGLCSTWYRRAQEAAETLEMLDESSPADTCSHQPCPSAVDRNRKNVRYWTR